MDEINQSDNSWITFHEPTPSLVKARLNITHIEVISSTVNQIEDDLLQLLIDEGIPLKVVKGDQDDEGISNAGTIIHIPILRNIDKQRNTIPKLSGSEGSIASVKDTIYILPSSKLIAIDNAIEVVAENNPLSTPLYLHFIPTFNESENIDTDDKTLRHARRISIDLLKECPIIPLAIAEELCQSETKLVRFTLKTGNASIVGIYEHFIVANTTQPIPTARKKAGNAGETSRCQHTDRSCSCSCSFCQGSCTCSTDEEEDSGINLDEQLSIKLSKGLASRCGCFKWTPNWLQRLASPRSYLLVFCIVSLFHGMLHSYTIAVMSTLEKRFRLKSTDVGLLLIGNDVSQILCTIIISFYGAYSHRPRWMGIASVICSGAVFLSAVPHFIYGIGELARESTVAIAHSVPIASGIELCQNSYPHECNKLLFSDDGYYYVIFFLFTSQFLIGVASSIFWTVGVSYLDDILPKKKTPIYFSAFTILRVIGPSLGFLLGRYCLTHWVHFGTWGNISRRDPRWIGAWWIGFVVLAVVLFITGIFYFCFPKHLPRKPVRSASGYFTEEYKRQENLLKCEIPLEVKTKSNSHSSRKNSKISSIPSLTELPPSLRRLFSNKIWRANLVSNTMFVMAFAGYWKFKPKYIEHQFRKSHNVATFYTGIVTMVASIVGIGISGIVLRYYRPRAKYVTAYNVFLSVFAFLSLFVVMELKCAPIEFAGHIPSQEAWVCSRHCTCSEAFSPVCAEDGVTNFYSPCYAGCAAVNILVLPKIYRNCSCVGRVKWKPVPGRLDENGKEVMVPIVEEGWAMQGLCPDNYCSAFYIFLGFQVFIKLVFATGRISGTLINIRSVEERDKTMALGCMSVFITLFGFLPSSWLMGMIIDSACLVWQHKCDSPEYCSFYDNKKFRILMHIVPAGFLIFSALGDIIVYLNHTKLDLFGENKCYKKKSKLKKDLEFNPEGNPKN